MKHLKFTFFFVVGLTISCNTRPQNSVETRGANKFRQLECYQYYHINDTISLTMEYQGDSITGTLTYKYFQKDKNVGILRGTTVNNLIIADYAFQSEGMQSIRQVIFKRVGDGLVEGYGDTEAKNGRDYFRNIDSLRFNESFLLKKEDCK